MINLMIVTGNTVAVHTAHDKKQLENLLVNSGPMFVFHGFVVTRTGNDKYATAFLDGSTGTDSLDTILEYLCLEEGW
jgi:hypothetical protein